MRYGSLAGLGLVAVALSAPSVCVYAQNTGDTSAGFYLGGSVGTSRTRFDGGAVPGAIVSGGNVNDTGWKVLGGYQFNKYFALEGSYIDFGRFSTGGFIGTTPMVLDAKASGVALAAVGIWPVTANFDLFGKIGANNTEIKSSAVAGPVFVSTSERRTDYTAGIGARYNFNRNFAVRIEAERYALRNSGEIDLYSAGIQYKF
jgi:OOP family OmpA-OmpF porin